MSGITYIVNEMYPCLQGEGPWLGTPSVLLRLQICNLRCTWCDTPYTHTYKSDPVDGKDPQGQQKFRRLSLNEIIDEIKKHPQIKHVIISGGEPTLQPIQNLFRELKKFNYSIEVESNGTRIPQKDLVGFEEPDYQNVQWNISPKGKNAGEKIVHEALEHWSQKLKEGITVFFKFVIRKNELKEDLDELLHLQKKYSWPASNIILMAEGTTQESQVDNVELEKICMEHNFKYSPRLHVLLHGAKRGV